MRVLEEIRMLSGVETTKEKVLRIILAGQPELNDKLDAPELEQLTQRVRLRFHLQTLTRDGNARLHPAPPGGGRRRRPRDVRRATPSGDFPLQRRRPAPHQHAVRHRHDGRLTADRDSVTRADIAAAVQELRLERTSPTGRTARSRRPSGCRRRRRRCARRRPPAMARLPAWPPTGAPCRKCRCSPGG